MIVVSYRVICARSQNVYRPILLCTGVGKCIVAVAPPGFCNRGEVRYGSIGGLEYEVPHPGCIVCVSTWLYARRPCDVFVVRYEEVPWQ